MAFRLYILPVIGTGAHNDGRRPKYFEDGTIDLSQYPNGPSYKDYGFQPWMIVGANLTVADDNLIIGKPDAFGIPFDLAPTLSGGQVNSVQNKLEAINVPAGWVNTTVTWITVVRTVLGMFQFFQRFDEVYSSANNQSHVDIFSGGVTLATTFGSLSLAVRNAMIATAQDFGFSTAGLTAGTTLRVILKSMADNFQGQQYNFNGTLI